MSQTDLHLAKLAKLEFYRSEINHEFGLLSGRVSAYLSSQSFLIIAFVSAMGNANARWGSLFTLIVPCALAVLGLALSLRAHDAIEAAVETIALWHVKQNRLFEGDALMDDYRVQRPAIKGEPVDAVHRRSLAFSRMVPRIFLLAWCVFFSFACFFHFKS